MITTPVTSDRLASSVIAVPPLARGKNWELLTEENRKIVQHLEVGGVSTMLYGGNAVLYHMRVSEYAAFLQMLVEIASSNTLMIPSVGPAFGTMLDQLPIIRDFDFPTVMVLPQRDVADADGIATGVRHFAEAYAKPVVLYLKHDRWLPASTVASLVDDGLVSWIKYAVVRDDPSQDDYLREVLEVVSPEIVVSGIGEQPAITHMREFGVVSFTSGCVCVNPALSMKMLSAIHENRWEDAEQIREQFFALEDLRNTINPIRVLHRALELAEIAGTGPMYPLLGELDAGQLNEISEAATVLKGLAEAKA